MESFVHLRKGRTPRRLHADLEGLKDDELGRGGFTGRTANMYRRNDPTAYRSVGPLRPVDVLSSELKPSDASDAAGGPLLMFSNADCLVLLSRRTEAMPFFVRYVDGDLLSFVHKGSGLLETEFGPLRYREGDWVYIPKACTFRQVPDEGASTLLMIQATDEFRVPPPGYLGRHFPFDPSQAVIPEAAPIDDDGRDEYEVRLIHPMMGRADFSLLPTQSARRGGLARRQLRLHLQHRGLQRGDVEQRAPAADGAPVHGGHRRLRDELPAQARRRRAGHRAHPVVSPQCRLRRDRVLPRRIALRHSDAARPGIPCAARGSPRGSRRRPASEPGASSTTTTRSTGQ